MNTQRTSGGSVTIGLPKNQAIELIDRFGMLRGRFVTAQEAAEAARRIWPDQEQDEFREGRGWDIQRAKKS